jgi:prephenate dehydratase
MLIKNFIKDIILEDKNAVNYEDNEYLIKDLERTNNYNEFVILNPYFAKNHNNKYCELIRKLKEFIFTEKCRYLVDILNILKESKIDLEEIRGYNMEFFKVSNLVCKFIIDLCLKLF